MSRNSLPPVEIWERKRLGQILRAIRQAKNISPDELACAVNRSRPFIANIEAGRKALPADLIPAVVQVLEVDPIVFAKAGAMTEDAA